MHCSKALNVVLFILHLCAKLLSHVRLFVTPWTVAHLAPLPVGILQARIREWVAMPFSRGSSQPIIISFFFFFLKKKGKLVSEMLKLA